MSLCGVVRGGVVWLRLGDSTSPALNAAGAVLEPQDLGAIEVSVVTEEGAPLGGADLSGLDWVGPGRFQGVVHLETAQDARVILQLEDTGSGRIAAVGPGEIRGDDFIPVLDIAHFRLDAPALDWREQVLLAVDASKGGWVTPDAGEFPLGTTVPLEAHGDTFYEFLYWEGDVPPDLAENAEVDLLMNRDRSVTAVFGLAVPEFWRLRHFDTVEVDLEDDPDEDGLTTRDEFALGTDPKSAAVAEQELVLAAGWNLVSLAVVPADGGARLDAFGPPVDPVAWGWDATVQTYVAASGLRTLAGMWVFASRSTLMRVTGQPVVDPVVRLYAGWNQVGAGIAATVPAVAAVEGRVWRWDAASQAYRPVPFGGSTTPGTGLWIRASQPAYMELEPAGSPE
jgi:hypothetical protein